MLADNPAQAGHEADEAVAISRERWKADPAAAGDDLAKSLFLAALIQQELPAKCNLAREAATVAHDPQFKDNVSRLLQTCGPR